MYTSALLHLTHYHDLTNFVLESSPVWMAWLRLWIRKYQEFILVFTLQADLRNKIDLIRFRFFLLKTTWRMFSTAQVCRKFRWITLWMNLKDSCELHRLLISAHFYTLHIQLCPTLQRDAPRNYLGGKRGLFLEPCPCLSPTARWEQRKMVLSITSWHTPWAGTMPVLLPLYTGVAGLNIQKLCNKYLWDEWMNKVSPAFISRGVYWAVERLSFLFFYDTQNPSLPCWRKHGIMELLGFPWWSSG